jgi:hypothetical protein
MATDYVVDGEGNARRVKISLDQILSTGNKQDGFAVMAKLEAMMRKFDLEHATITHFIIFSENAGCYHLKEVILIIPILNMMMKRVRIIRFLHTETQDDKGDCDAHGAVAERHIDVNWLRSRDDGLENKMVTTSKELASAIACKGGIQNNGKCPCCLL